MMHKAFEGSAKAGGAGSVVTAVYNFFASKPLDTWVQLCALAGGVLYAIYMGIKIFRELREMKKESS